MGEELLSLRPQGVRGGETQRDEVEAVGPASASMLVTARVTVTRPLCGHVIYVRNTYI